MGRQVVADEGGCWSLRERPAVGIFFLLLTPPFELLLRMTNPLLQACKLEPMLLGFYRVVGDGSHGGAFAEMTSTILLAGLVYRAITQKACRKYGATLQRVFDY